MSFSNCAPAGNATSCGGNCYPLIKRSTIATMRAARTATATSRRKRIGPTQRAACKGRSCRRVRPKGREAFPLATQEPYGNHTQSEPSRTGIESNAQAQCICAVSAEADVVQSDNLCKRIGEHCFQSSRRVPVPQHFHSLRAWGFLEVSCVDSACVTRYCW